VDYVILVAGAALAFLFVPAGRSRGMAVGAVICLWAVGTALYSYIENYDPAYFVFLHILLWGGLGLGVVLYNWLRPNMKGSKAA